MDQIFDRFGNLLRSFLDNDSTDDTSFSDPDLQDAWDELEDFLSSDGTGSSRSSTASAESGSTPRPESPGIPEALKKDYTLLNAKPGTPLPEVAKSYRQLLRIHHPDRHAADPAAYANATEKTKQLTTAFRRIKIYVETGKMS